METDETSETIFFKCRLFLGLGGATGTGKTFLLGVFSLLASSASRFAGSRPSRTAKSPGAARFHSSVKITERHYAPWVRERQEQMEADVRRAWERDPILNRTISVQPKDVLPI